MTYLQGGLQLNLSVAIDFTGSNGVVTHPTSLHYMNQYNLNQYQRAIMAIGGILLDYDYDKKIPAFGFGAKLRFPMMASNMVSHCFPLSGNNL
jgi:Copine